MHKYMKLADEILEFQRTDNSTDRAEAKTIRRKENRIRHAGVIKEHVPSCQKILCLGCRSPSELQDFKDAGYEVLGIDVVPSKSEDMLELDAHLIEEKFGEDEFDFVYASHSLEHMYDPDRVLRGIRNVSRLGCMVILPTYGVSVRSKRKPGLSHPALFDICLANRLLASDVTDLDLADFGSFHPYEFRYYCHWLFGSKPEKANQCEVLFAWTKE